MEKELFDSVGWLKAELGVSKPISKPMSPLGEAVAKMLGILFYGIYHLDLKSLRKVDWSNQQWIEISLGHKTLATADFDELTRLVFLAHHFSVRIEISASTRNYIKLIFHQRERAGSYTNRHPRLSEAVSRFEQDMKNFEIDEFCNVEETAIDPEYAAVIENADAPAEEEKG